MTVASDSSSWKQVLLKWFLMICSLIYSVVMSAALMVVFSFICGSVLLDGSMAAPEAQEDGCLPFKAIFFRLHDKALKMAYSALKGVVCFMTMPVQEICLKQQTLSCVQGLFLYFCV